MPLLDGILRRLPKRRPARTNGIMDRFEVTGLHSLSSTIELRRDTAGNLMIVFFGALAVFIVAAMWFGTFSKQETMRGLVLGTKGGQRITVPIGGTVKKVWIEQGQAVTTGQKLLTVIPQQTASGASPLSETDLQALIDQKANTEQQIASIKTLMARDTQDMQSFDANIEALTNNLRSQERELERSVAAQRDIVQRMQRYLKVGYTTRDSVTAQERAWQDYAQQLAAARLQLAQLSGTSLERLRAVQQNNNYSANQLADMGRLISELTAKIERAKSAISTDIVAVTNGKVAAINVREGAEVTVGDTVAAIGDPDAPFIIGLQAPSKSMGLLTIGQRVVLKYDAFPYKTFGVKYGRVIAISAQPVTLPKEDEQSMAMVNPALAQSAQSAPPQSKFLVEVEPEDKTISAYGVDRPILIGSTLSADVIVERRRLIDWVLDPILAMRGRT